MAKIDALFDEMLAQGGSDLHLSEGQIPKVRLHGRLVPLGDNHPTLDSKTITKYLEEICPKERWDLFLEVRDLDFAYAYQDIARFRANYYYQVNGKGAIFRVIPTKILTLDDLKLPSILRSFSTMKSGLVLVTGPTGSGKSTTLAAIINEINETSHRHILTIEEPIEFVHPNKKSVLCQREVHADVHSFADGLKAASRQDCDVILVGEMRDYETISLAVSAAATGALVFGTLHTNSAIKTVDRIIDAFPPDQQPQIRTMLGDSLKGVVAQLLLKTADKKGRVACNEILLSTSGLSASIRDGNIGNIRNIIQGGKGQGMQLMDDAIMGFLNQGLISGEEAYMKAIEKNRFEQYAPIK